MSQLTVQAIVSHVMDRLASGLYPPGSRLPTSRELATELGAHRNTVAKAYRSLADLGLVATTPGRGTFAMARVEEDNRRAQTQQIHARLAEDILRARRSNMTEADLRRAIDAQIAAIYHAAPPRAAFVECNAEDLNVAISEIAQQSGVRLAPLLLDTLAADPASVAASYGVVFTSLFHLLEVRELLAAAPGRRIVGIYTQPDERALAEIAQIAPGARVGIVVSNSDGARRFAAQIQTFTRATVRVLVRPSDEEIVALGREVDLIVTSRSRAAQVRRLHLGTPLIELSFHISRESAHRVVEVVQDANGTSSGRLEEPEPGRGAMAVGPEGTLSS
jgi:DNA-binding transcriptional regulator YhcF (GntR family)